MSMHQGIDFSRFKKVSSDKKTSTLRHAQGHEIKVAHSALSPEMREKISNLPVYMAEGGDVEAPDDLDLEDDSNIEDEADTSDDEVTPEVEAPMDAGPAHPKYLVSNGPPPKPEDMGPAAQAALASAPANNEIVVTGHQKPAPRPQDLDNEDALYAQDLQRGHIKPETYQSLYEKKDTLGKIGTLFGLLVSGAGSGLTGQPNAVLAMMDTVIKNDLEAQKLSNENSQNWLRLSQAHQRNKAELAQMGANTENIKAHTGAIPAEIKRNEAAADLEATQAALNRARMTAAGYIDTHIIKKMPEGPAKVDAIDKFQNQVVPGIKKENQDGNIKTAAKINMLNAMAPKPQAPAGKANDVQMVDTARIQNLNEKARAAESIQANPPHGSIPSPQLAVVMKEAGEVNRNRATYKTLRDAFESLDKEALGGAINFKNHQTIVEHAAGQLERSGMSRDSAYALAESSLPGAKDFLKTRGTKASQLYDQFRNNEETASNLKGFPGLVPPFPGPPKLTKSATTKGPKQTAPTEQYKVVDGVKYKRGPNGEAIKVDQ